MVMERYLQTDLGDYRLVQFRVDHYELTEYTREHIEQLFPPDDILSGITYTPGELIGLWRETSRKGKLHYHAILIVKDQPKLKDAFAPLKKRILRRGAPKDACAVKIYNSRNMKDRNIAYYIGYCSKCDDPIIPFEYRDECYAEYERINKALGNDDYFKSYMLKHLSNEPSDQEILDMLKAWYKDKFTDHSPLIISQKYWKVLSFMDPDRYDQQMDIAVKKILGID